MLSNEQCSEASLLLMWGAFMPVTMTHINSSLQLHNTLRGGKETQNVIIHSRFTMILLYFLFANSESGSGIKESQLSCPILLFGLMSEVICVESAVRL